MVAKEYHVDNIDNVARKAFQESDLGSFRDHIHAVAVTTRPGLEHSLQVGIDYAKQLSRKYSKPLIPIHHMQAHALMPLLEHRQIRFPYLALLISGGHCLISICKRYNQFDLLGTSLDNAPGELLDKIARRCRLKNLGPPFDCVSGGAAIELLSRRPNADRFKYFNDGTCLPMAGHCGCDMSFAGYRGSFDDLVPTIDDVWRGGDREKLLDELGHLCSSIQRVMLIQIVKKLQRAIGYYRMFWRHQNSSLFEDDPHVQESIGYRVRSMDESDSLDLVISGGVAANSYIVEGIRSACLEIDEEMRVFAPSKDLCSDNGLMVAWNGLLRYKDYLSDKKKFDKIPLDENVINESEDIDIIQAQPESPIGQDIREKVSMARFPLARLRNPELKMREKVVSPN